MKHKAVIVLEALIAGQTIDWSGGYKVLMQDNRILIRAQKVRIHGINQQVEDVLLGFPLDLEGFIADCERIPDDQIAIIGANVVLTRLHKKIDHKSQTSEGR